MPAGSTAAAATIIRSRRRWFWWNASLYPLQKLPARTKPSRNCTEVSDYFLTRFRNDVRLTQKCIVFTPLAVPAGGSNRRAVKIQPQGSLQRHLVQHRHLTAGRFVGRERRVTHAQVNVLEFPVGEAGIAARHLPVVQMPELQGRWQEPEFFLSFPDYVHETFARPVVPADAHVNQAGIRVLVLRTPLEQYPSRRRDDPQVQCAVPVPVRMDECTFLYLPGGGALLIEHLKQFPRILSHEWNHTPACGLPRSRHSGGRVTSWCTAKGGGFHMATTETVETGGYSMRAEQLPDGTWTGEVVERALPRLQADTLDNLKTEFESVIRALVENEAELTGESLDTREDALLRNVHLYPSGTAPVADMDMVDRPDHGLPEPEVREDAWQGPSDRKLKQEPWED